MAYNPATQIITDPVSINDVQRALGASANDVGRLCVHTMVRKWAKYKPVKVAKIAPLVVADRAAINYGITDIPVWSRLTYMNTFLFAASRGSLSQVYWPTCDIAKGALSLEYWAWEKPTGGLTSPYRLSDFDDYYHGVGEPMGNMAATTIHIDPTAVLRVQFPLSGTRSDVLNFTDFRLADAGSIQVSGMYFGVLMKQKTGGVSGSSYILTQSTTVATLSSNGAVVDIQLSASETGWAGVWNIYPIFSQVAITTKKSNSDFATFDGSYFTCPLPFHGNDITVDIAYAKAILVNATGYKDGSSSQRYAVVTSVLKNEESVARNYRVTVTLCDAQGNQLSGYTGGQATGTIPANSSSYAVDVELYIAQIWNTTMYFKVKTEITDSDVVFKQEDNWALTGPMQIVTP